MARYENTSAVSLIAGEALPIARCVYVSGANEASLTTGAGDRPAGVTAEAVAIGDVCPVSSKQGSIVLIELAATLAAGVRVSADATGAAVAATTTVDQFTMGTLVSGGDAGDIVDMIFDPAVDAGT